MNRAGRCHQWMLPACRWILGGVFLLAGIPKILNPAQFALDVANYRLLPHEWIHLVAITLPWIEALAGGLLILGRWVRPSSWVITGMMILFVVVISSALARGLNIECGCFGTIAGRRIGLTSLAIDSVLLILALWLSWRAREPAHTPALCPERGL